MNSINHSIESVDPLGKTFSCQVKEAPRASGKAPLPAGDGVSLVNTTKLCDASYNAACEVRSTNFKLRNIAQSVLGHNHRVFSCQKVPSYGVQKLGHSRGISKNVDGKAFYHGIGVCGDVHCCPVCSVKISEGRRQEVVHALRSHSESGYISLFATFTIRHSRDDSLSDNVSSFRNARSDLIRSQKYRKIKDRICMSGYIRRLEVTWGNSNGWHPHDHEVWLIDKKTISASELQVLQLEIFELWEHYCKKYNLEAPSFLHGFDLRWKEGDGSSSVGAYLTKWGHELTYGHTKKANGEDRHTPFSLLYSLKENYNPKFAALYQEYAKAFKGRAQLLWSRGLKAKFGIQEFTDGELTERPEKIPYCDLSVEQSFRISFLNKFSTVLDYAELHPPELTFLYIDSLSQQANSILTKNFKRRRSNYISDLTLSDMFDRGIYESEIS